MKNKVEFYGLWTALGTYLLLLLLVFKLGQFETVLDGLYNFLTINIDHASQETVGFSTIIPVILTVTVLHVPCTLLALVVTVMCLPESGEHKVDRVLRSKKGLSFREFFLLTSVEEIFARWLFLGFIPQLVPSFSFPLQFFILFLLGNGIWAYLHLDNFEEGKDRRWLMVLPQFVGGVFNTYLFVLYGLWAAILGHFAYNAILFATSKAKDIAKTDVLVCGYYGFLALASYLLMRQPLGDILLWFSSKPIFVLPSWGWWDYVCLYVFVSSTLSLMSGLLLFDREEKNKNAKSLGPLGIVISIPIIVVVMQEAYHLLGWVAHDLPYRVLALTVLFAFLGGRSSPNGLARVFWLSLTNVYFWICTMQALGFWMNICFLGIIALMVVPPKYIRMLDEPAEVETKEVEKAVDEEAG